MDSHNHSLNQSCPIRGYYMSIPIILSNLVLVGGVGCLSFGYYMQTKEAYFKQLFTKIEKCQKFHLDYVDSPTHLPLDKPVLLFGTARALDPTPDKVIARTYIKQTPEEDRLWRFHFQNRFGMALTGSEMVEVQPAPNGEKILAFNLHKKQQDGNHEQRVIHHNEPVCAFGTLSKIGENGRKMHPQMLMGSKQEQALAFLDQQILRIHNRARPAVLIGSLLLLTHVGLKMLWGNSKKSQNTAKILAQMQTKNA